MFGYVKVGAAVPRLRLADCTYNKEQIIEMAKDAATKGVRVLTFPELCITGYTCADLFFQETLLQASVAGLEEIFLGDRRKIKEFGCNFCFQLY